MGWRGEPAAGAGYGAGTQDYSSGMGGGMPSTLAAGSGMKGAAGDWHPSIMYLFALIIGEMIVFGLVAKMLR